MRILFLITICIIFLGCENKLKKDLQESVEKITDDLKLPSPTWDKDLEELRTEYKERYNAKEVRFTRPFFYTSKEDYSYWLKVEFLNPELNNTPFKEFGREVSLNTLDHLTNDRDFQKIEISVTQRKGFIITFSSSQNAFFYRDSLQVTPR